MKVFLTGASGALGTALIPQLLAAGHSVLALSRSPQSDEKIKASSSGRAEIVHGTVADTSVLAHAASQSDAVIHAAFNHDVFDEPDGYSRALAEDRAAITALGDALASSGSSSGSSSSSSSGSSGTSKKTLIYTSGTLGNAGTDEASGSIKIEALARYQSEDLVLAYAPRGLRGLVVKLAPVVHKATLEHWFILAQIAAAKKSGYAAYVGDGSNVWCSSHYDDVAALLVLCLTKGESGYYHAVDEEGIPTREIAEFIGNKLGVPTKSIDAETAQRDIGTIGILMTLGKRATATYTKSVTGWQPHQPGLFADLENYKY